MRPVQGHSQDVLRRRLIGVVDGKCRSMTAFRPVLSFSSPDIRSVIFKSCIFRRFHEAFECRRRKIIMIDRRLSTYLHLYICFCICFLLITIGNAGPEND